MKVLRPLSAWRGLQRNVLEAVGFRKERAMQFLPILFTLPLTMSLTLADYRIFPKDTGWSTLPAEWEASINCHVTAPLLRAVHDLKNSQNELCKLLVQKDKEINEYREEGARLYYEHIKRLNALLRAPEFNYDEYKAQNTSLAKLFKNDDILNCIVKKIIDQETHVTLKKKKTNEITSSTSSNNSLLCNEVKEECTSTSGNSFHCGEPSGIESVENANETHTTSMPAQSIKEESKDMARRHLKRELTDPVSNGTAPVIIKEENIQIPSSNSIIKKKPKKLFNL
ncbi:hypothetical protein EVAR_40262_1 [Eumeta japonica]|uniref:XLF-like coiled-coil region domain-containing protein n=1 Tax=Eumeta variegata TaxID=151549 RepID=A0A4C1Y4N1_EUMVA|nr:hypothetical protein EVAR_40262_1 [Eumeta japonica]